MYPIDFLLRRLKRFPLHVASVLLTLVAPVWQSAYAQVTDPAAFTVPIYVNLTTTGPDRYNIYAGINGGPNLPYLFDTGAPNFFSVVGNQSRSQTNQSFSFAESLTYYYGIDHVSVTLGTSTQNIVTTAPVNYAQVNAIKLGTNVPNAQSGSHLKNGTYGDFGAGLYGSSTLATILAQVPLPAGYKTGYLLDVTGSNSPQGSLLLGLSPSLIAAMTNLPGAIVLPLSLTGTNIPASGTNNVPGANKAQFGNALIELFPPEFRTNLPIVFDTGGGNNAVIYAEGVPTNYDRLSVGVALGAGTQTLYTVQEKTPWGGGITVSNNVSGGTRINSGGYFFQNYRMMVDLTDSQLVLAPPASVITPERVNLVPSLLKPSDNSLGGNPHFKYGIYASLAGSTTPQLYEVDTGGTGFYAAYTHDHQYAAYAPAWGTNLQTNNPTNGYFQYTSGNTYQGPSVNTSFTLYSSNTPWSNNASGLTPLVTSMTNILVGQTTNISNVNKGTELWPSTNPPIPNGFYGDFGLGLSWNSNNIVNPLAQLYYGNNLIPGYLVHLGYQPTSTNYYSSGAGAANTPYLQVGLTEAQLAAYPYRFALLTSPPVNSYTNSGVPSYAEASFIASMTISNPALGVTNISIPVILDTGATPEFHYTSNYAALANFFSVSSDAPGFLSMVVTNTDGVPVTLYQSELSPNGTNSIDVGTTNVNVFGGYNYDFNIGEQLFYQYDVAFNLRDGIIAFNPLNGQVTNTGTVTYTANTTLASLSVAGGLTSINAGVLVNSSGGGIVSAGGLLINGTLVTPSLQIGAGGVLGGSGTFNGNLANGGLLSPGNSPGTLTVNGNFVQTGSGNLLIEVGNGSQDFVNVSGAATLGGTLVVTPYGGHQFQYGDQIVFMSAASISGSFSSVVVPAGFRGRVKIFGDPQLEVLFAPASYTQLAGNQNQYQVATALDSFIPATSGDQLTVSTSLDSLTAPQYNQAFNAIMPTFYQQMATIALNQANAQNMQLVQRLWGLRVTEGGGFSMSGLADNYAMLEGQGDGSKGVLDAKNDILRPGLDNHWGMFVDGNGIFAQANSGNMLPGYSSQSGGVTTGLTYKWNENFASGLYAGYQGTYTKSGANASGLGTGSSLIDNAVRFGVFGTYGQKDGKGLYVNALAGGGYHNFQAARVIQYAGMNRTANSAPGAGELDTMLAAGYDIKKGKFTFGPTASLQYTYLGVNSLNETGAQSLSFNSGGWNSSSMLSSVGAHAAYSWVASKNILVVPQVNLSWQHEFMQNPYAISGNLGGTSPTFSNWSATPIRDFLYTGVGFTVEFAKRWNTSFFYNAAAGNSDLVSQNIFWSAGVRF